MIALVNTDLLGAGALPRTRCPHKARRSPSVGWHPSSVGWHPAAVDAYAPQIANDRDFALAAGFARVDRDPRPISQIADSELFAGFGE